MSVDYRHKINNTITNLVLESLNQFVSGVNEEEAPKTKGKTKATPKAKTAPKTKAAPKAKSNTEEKVISNGPICFYGNVIFNEDDPKSTINISYTELNTLKCKVLNEKSSTIIKNVNTTDNKTCFAIAFPEYWDFSNEIMVNSPEQGGARNVNFKKDSGVSYKKITILVDGKPTNYNLFVYLSQSPINISNINLVKTRDTSNDRYKRYSDDEILRYTGYEKPIMGNSVYYYDTKSNKFTEYSVNSSKSDVNQKNMGITNRYGKPIESQQDLVDMEPEIIDLFKKLIISRFSNNENFDVIWGNLSNRLYRYFIGMTLFGKNDEHEIDYFRNIMTELLLKWRDTILDSNSLDKILKTPELYQSVRSDIKKHKYFVIKDTEIATGKESWFDNHMYEDAEIANLVITQLRRINRKKRIEIKNIKSNIIELKDKIEPLKNEIKTLEEEKEKIIQGVDKGQKYIYQQHIKKINDKINDLKHELENLISLYNESENNLTTYLINNDVHEYKIKGVDTSNESFVGRWPHIVELNPKTGKVVKQYSKIYKDDNSAKIELRQILSKRNKNTNVVYSVWKNNINDNYSLNSPFPSINKTDSDLPQTKINEEKKPLSPEEEKFGTWLTRKEPIQKKAFKNLGFPNFECDYSKMEFPNYLNVQYDKPGIRFYLGVQRFFLPSPKSDNSEQGIIPISDIALEERAKGLFVEFAHDLMILNRRIFDDSRIFSRKGIMSLFGNESNDDNDDIEITSDMSMANNIAVQNNELEEINFTNSVFNPYYRIIIPNGVNILEYLDNKKDIELILNLLDLILKVKMKYREINKDGIKEKSSRIYKKNKEKTGNIYGIDTKGNEMMRYYLSVIERLSDDEFKEDGSGVMVLNDSNPHLDRKKFKEFLKGLRHVHKSIFDTTYKDTEKNKLAILKREEDCGKYSYNSDFIESDMNLDVLKSFRDTIMYILNNQDFYRDILEILRYSHDNTVSINIALIRHYAFYILSIYNDLGVEVKDKHTKINKYVKINDYFNLENIPFDEIITNSALKYAEILAYKDKGNIQGIDWINQINPNNKRSKEKYEKDNGKYIQFGGNVEIENIARNVADEVKKIFYTSIPTNGADKIKYIQLITKVVIHAINGFTSTMDFKNKLKKLVIFDTWRKVMGEMFPWDNNTQNNKKGNTLVFRHYRQDISQCLDMVKSILIFEYLEDSGLLNGTNTENYFSKINLPHSQEAPTGTPTEIPNEEERNKNIPYLTNNTNNQDYSPEEMVRLSKEIEKKIEDDEKARNNIDYQIKNKINKMNGTDGKPMTESQLRKIMYNSICKYLNEMVARKFYEKNK